VQVVDVVVARVRTGHAAGRAAVPIARQRGGALALPGAGVTNGAAVTAAAA